jgi:hypothetical protein
VFLIANTKAKIDQEIADLKSDEGNRAAELNVVKAFLGP